MVLLGRRSMEVTPRWLVYKFYNTIASGDTNTSDATVSQNTGT